MSDILEIVKLTYAANMNKEAYDYLQNRGISRTSSNKFELGFHTKGLLSKTLTKNQLESALNVSKTLFFDYTSEKQQYLDSDPRIVYPLYKMVLGKYIIAGFHSRSILEASRFPHRHTTGLVHSIFNEKALEGKKTITITEGQNDCIIMNQIGVNSVGILGASRFGRKEAGIFSDYGIKEAYLFFDNDENKAGDKGARKTAEALCRVGIQPFIATLPKIYNTKSTDINELYLLLGESFKQMVHKCIATAERYHRMIVIKERPIKSPLKVRASIHEFYDFGSLDRKQIMTHCMLPGHKDDNPSFSYNPIKNVFFCFHCGKGGGVVEFIMFWKILDRQSAIQFINERVEYVENNV